MEGLNQKFLPIFTIDCLSKLKAYYPDEFIFDNHLSDAAVPYYPAFML